MNFLTSNRLLPLSELLEVYVHLGIAEFDLFVAFRHLCEEVSLVGELGLPKNQNKTRTRGDQTFPKCMEVSSAVPVGFNKKQEVYASSSKKRQQQTTYLLFFFFFCWLPVWLFTFHWKENLMPERVLLFSQVFAKENKHLQFFQPENHFTVTRYTLPLLLLQLHTPLRVPGINSHCFLFFNVFQVVPDLQCFLIRFM